MTINVQMSSCQGNAHFKSCNTMAAEQSLKCISNQFCVFSLQIEYTDHSLRAEPPWYPVIALREQERARVEGAQPLQEVAATAVRVQRVELLLLKLLLLLLVGVVGHGDLTLEEAEEK